MVWKCSNIKTCFVVIFHIYAIIIYTASHVLTLTYIHIFMFLHLDVSLYVEYYAVILHMSIVVEQFLNIYSWLTYFGVVSVPNEQMMFHFRVQETKCLSYFSALNNWVWIYVRLASWISLSVLFPSSLMNNKFPYMPISRILSAMGQLYFWRGLIKGLFVRVI